MYGQFQLIDTLRKHLPGQFQLLESTRHQLVPPFQLLLIGSEINCPNKNPIIRAKRVSNCYTQKKKSVRVLILVLVAKKIVRVFD